MRRPQPPLAVADVDAYLQHHRGPVLDVRMPGDCDRQPALRRTTHRVTFDITIEDRDIKAMADDLFIAQVREHRAFVQANRNQRPILVVCCGGGRSEAAAALLARRGFNSLSLAGGLQAVAATSAALQPN